MGEGSLGLGHTWEHLPTYSAGCSTWRKRLSSLHTQALAIARETGDRQGEGNRLGNLGLCHYGLGEYRRAIELHTQALAIARETGYRRSEGIGLGNLGLCHYSLGEYRRAIELHDPSTGHRPRHRLPVHRS